ncbi:MAG: class I SAM-dependent methyltransferase [Acidimicrobiales bacterium]
MSHWFEGVAETLGTSYLKYSFTKGTANEVDAIIDLLDLSTDDRILDVGCGPGRHAHELAKRGFRVHGVDISERFIDLARADAPGGATFEVADARTWAAPEPFDAAITLCQGAFGLADGPGAESAVDPDLLILQRIAANVVPGGRFAASAFSAYFQVRHLSDSDDFNADSGVNHEHTTLRDESGTDHPAELWTTCLTPRELRLMCTAAGLTVDHVYSASPGKYGRHDPTIDSEEFLVIATVGT